MRPAHFSYLLLLAMFLASSQSHGKTWDTDDFMVAIGTPEASEDGLTLRPNELAQAMITLPGAGMSLESNFRITVEHSGAVPSAVYVIWRNDTQDTLHQHGIKPSSEGRTRFDMRSVTGWTGELRSLEVGFLIPSGQPINVDKITLDKPGSPDKIESALRSWTSYRSWMPWDVNYLFGTHDDFRQGPFPVVAVLVATTLVLVTYGLIRRRKSRYIEVAGIIFCAWLILDSLWQARLWRQVADTTQRYLNLTPSEKLLASEDAFFARLGGRINAVVKDPNSRVFIASAEDAYGMLAAYYVAPLNTYWDRHGAELPPPQYLRTGDYILLIAATSASYQPGSDVLKLEDGHTVPVEQRLADQATFLLEVQ